MFVEVKTGFDRRGALDEELHGFGAAQRFQSEGIEVGQGQRWHAVDGFAGDTQRLAAAGDDLQAWAAA